MKNLTEYSKKVLHLMIVLWFIGAAFGAAVVVVELIATLTASEYSMITPTIHLPELLVYIGGPVGGGVLGYLLKSAFENREKIKKGAGPHPAEEIIQEDFLYEDIY